MLDRRGCILCPNTAPSCPACGENEQCQLISATCNSCARTICAKVGGTSNAPKTNTGAIAGGVIGGIVVVCLITFLVWRFCIRNRRRQYEEDWQEQEEKDNNQFNMQRDARASTHTVGSIASTVLTRASNVIHIAYIPGITNRSESQPGTPGILVPPVPPLPVASNPGSTASTPNTGIEQHFFMPDNLRDSTWSGTSDGRASLAPSLTRSSVATTIYRNNAVINPIPAQTATALRGNAKVVSVKSSGSNTPDDTSAASTPPVPQLSQSLSNSNSPFVARAMTAKPVQVTRSNSSRKAFTPSSLRSQVSSETVIRHAKSSTSSVKPNSGFDSDSESDSEKSTRTRRSNTQPSPQSATSTQFEDSPFIKQSPFLTSKESQAQSSGVSHKKTSSLADIIEEAARRVSKDHTSGRGEPYTSLSHENKENEDAGAKGKGSPSPFDDEHEVRSVRSMKGW